jgi:acyl-CoA synthetase (NDP forming)/GNAT superfamily N-acetyltransferase
MPVRHLDKLFHPRSVAILGASDRPGSLGGQVLRNLLKGGFQGPVMPVNPNRASVAGILTYPDIGSLPVVPDLAVVCVGADKVPGAIEELAVVGTHAAILISNGVTGELLDRTKAAARRGGIRLLGAGSMGLLVPGGDLNASCSHLPASGGRVAFVSQSATMCTAVLDWARAHGIGFSHFVSLGETDDLDFGDVLDYLGSEPDTRAILLHIESIGERRNFMSAARAAARNKPVLVLKAGRFVDGIPSEADAVFDAAVRRAGMLRVFDLGELFAAVQTLARVRPLPGDRLAIVSNGSGFAAMAVDEVEAAGGRLALLPEATLEALDAVMPKGWKRGNPVDLGGNAPAGLYRKALEILGRAPGVDAILVMHAPAPATSSLEAAEAVVEAARTAWAGIFTTWIGEEAVAPARRHLEEAGIPTYPLPGRAVGAFLHLVAYRRNQELLMETPASTSEDFPVDAAAARRIVSEALARGERVLKGDAAAALLSAYGLETGEAGGERPEGAHDLMAGVVGDRLFGPVILFGQGGAGIDLVKDRAYGLPPLNMILAREMVERTRISRVLEGDGDASLDRLCRALVGLSRLVVDLPRVVAVEVNPLVADGTSLKALRARVRLAAEDEAPRRLAIQPYPRELEEIFTMRNGRRVLLRPIRPEDEPEHHVFVSRLTPEDVRFRFFGSVKGLPHSQMARLTQIDYDREMAFIATASAAAAGEERETLGVVRTSTDPDNERAEFAIVVRSDLKGQGLGLGRKLLDKMVGYCRSRGTRRMVGQILADNDRMLELARGMGFSVAPLPGEEVIEVALDL